MPKDYFTEEVEISQPDFYNQEVEQDYFDKEVSNNQNSTFEGGEAIKQFFIGLGNSAAFSVPELIAKDDFKNLESQNQGERIARGFGTAAGFISPFGLPSLAWKAGEKLALKGLAKVAPKIAEGAIKGSPVMKAAIKGAGGGLVYSALDPATSLEEKPTNIIGGMAGGATLGAVAYKLPAAIKAMMNKDKRLSVATKEAISSAVEQPSLLTETGEAVNPRAELVPSLKRQIPADAKNLIDDLKARETEILAADRGIIPAKEQVRLSKSINVDDNFWNSLKPGATANAETMFAMRINLAERLGSLGKNPTKEVIEQLSKDFIKADAIASETGRTLGSLNRVQSMAADQLKYMTEQFSKLDPEAVGAAQKLFKQFQAPSFWDKFMEFRTASLLSSPFTHIRNLVGNTIPRLFSPFEKTIAGTTNKIESLLTGEKQKVFASEGMADVIGVINGFRPALRNALQAFKSEDFSSNERLQEAVKFGKAISGVNGQVIRTPFRFLSAVDEFYSTLGKHASIYSQATRQALTEKSKDIPSRIAELIKSPTPEMIERAVNDSLKDTYRQPLGSAAKHLQTAINKSKWGKIVIPFFRTPVNLFKWTAERTPATSLFAGWKPLQGTPEQRAEAIGKIAFGQLLTASVASWAWDGNITGKLSDSAEKRAAYQRQGIQPYSIKIGDKYISYRSYEPISSWLALVANSIEVAKSNDKLDSNKSMQIVMETVKMMKDQSFMQGISDLTNALDNPERYGNQFLQNTATSLIPNGVGYAARLADPTLREVNSIPDAIKSRLPYYSKSLPPKLDLWGNQITKEGSLFQKALLPSGVSTYKPSLIEEELISLEKFPKKITEKYRGLKLTIQERNNVTIVEGKIIKGLLDKFINSDRYKSMDPEDQKNVIDKIFSKTRSAVRKNMLDPIFLNKIRSLKTTEEKIMMLEEYTNKRILKK